MRPVTKPKPTHYAYHTLKSLDTTMTFIAGSALSKLYDEHAATLKESVGWAQNQLLDKWVLKKHDFPYPQNPQILTQAKNNLYERLTALYGEARKDLVDSLGDYCSFCEIPLKGYAPAIEHRAPKSIYPTYIVRWRNFLLACSECNSNKGDKPTRKKAAGWSGVAPPTEADLYKAILDHFGWPDIFTETFRLYQRQYYRTGIHPEPPSVRMSSVNYSWVGNKRMVSLAGQVTAEVQNAAGLTLSDNRVTVKISSDFLQSGKMCKLLKLSASDDFRSLARTAAWLKICAFLKLSLDTMRDAPSDTTKKSNFLFREMAKIADYAVELGFYSVWVDVLKEHQLPAGIDPKLAKFNNLGEIFVWWTNAATNPKRPLEVFPGTDVTEVP